MHDHKGIEFYKTRILMFGWMITFYLLAHGMKPDAYLSDRQSDSVDEEALMCRMGWKTEKDKENYSKETADPEHRRRIMIQQAN
ncbi:hypothetical protein IFM46972_08606 [Aspergillus udagawae]|uniref:Uncharacterized protein n=1 Tax=Aspergillus udagawae TaxID=91492 RepID=A0A8H3PG72_9EURO|nr:hypothetical protein IFM46972_08606 [Aspergillus udagawae]